MKLVKKLAAVPASAYALAISTHAVMAQAAKPTLSGFDDTAAASAGFRIQDLGLLFQRVLNLIMIIAALLVFGYMIWGGVQWITSGGDKGKTEEARNKITSAVIGLAVLAASYALFRVVLYFLGLNDPTQGIEAIKPAYQK